MLNDILLAQIIFDLCLSARLRDVGGAFVALARMDFLTFLAALAMRRTFLVLGAAFFAVLARPRDAVFLAMRVSSISDWGIEFT